jgi:hypothetical protein
VDTLFNSAASKAKRISTYQHLLYISTPMRVQLLVSNVLQQQPQGKLLASLICINLLLLIKLQPQRHRPRAPQQRQQEGALLQNARKLPRMRHS